MKFLKKLLLFLAGGSGYVLLELLWRGRSHSSMFFAGGSCFLLLGRLQRKKRTLPLPVRAAAGAGVITGVELLFGLLVNRDYRVWDYRDTPFNLLGQICLPFTLLWAPLSVVAMGLYGHLEHLLLRRK